jgi:hypothetical protein
MTSIPPKHIGTISLALAAWKARCKHEAETMDKWAKDYEDRPEMADNCRRNAAASRGFIVEADEALEALGLR